MATENMEQNMLGFGNKYKKENKVLKEKIKNLQLDIKNILFSHQVYKERLRTKQTWFTKLKRLF